MGYPLGDIGHSNHLVQNGEQGLCCHCLRCMASDEPIEGSTVTDVTGCGSVGSESRIKKFRSGAETEEDEGEAENKVDSKNRTKKRCWIEEPGRRAQDLSTRLLR